MAVSSQRAAPPVSALPPEPTQADQIAMAVDRLLCAAVDARASDLHLRPTSDGLEVSWRRDGVMQPLTRWPGPLAVNVLSRLKVLADLLTYRTDLPQEGRLRSPRPGVEMRLSTFPTLHGEKGVIRFFAGSGSLQRLGDLGLPEAHLMALRTELAQTSGCLVFAGPAGAGKTTTAYACLRELQASNPGKSLVTLEDPIEAELPGVSQTQVHRPVEFSYGLGLRSLMRQDPDVILVGEIRDPETAQTAFQASLTGHLVLSTLHAGSSAQGVTRLRELGVAPYLLRTGLRGLMCQRLLRKRCGCAGDECARCWGTGYYGRALVSEWLDPSSRLRQLDDWPILSAEPIEQAACAAGMVALTPSAWELVQRGITTADEVLRVLGALPDGALLST